MLLPSLKEVGGTHSQLSFLLISPNSQSVYKASFTSSFGEKWSTTTLATVPLGIQRARYQSALSLLIQLSVLFTGDWQKKE